jgi:hypothetical protein
MMNVLAWVAGFTAFYWVRLRGLLDPRLCLELESMSEMDRDSMTPRVLLGDFMTPWVLDGVTSRALLGILDGL